MHNTPLMFQLDFYGPVSGLQHICMLWRVKKRNHLWLFFYNLNVMTDFSALQKALVRWSPAKSHLAAWQRMSLICDFQFAVMSPLDAVLQQRCPFWHHCFFVFFQVLQSQSRERRWTNDIVFGASEVTDIYCRQRSKAEIKKSFNKERITFPLNVSRKEFKWGSTEKRFA